MKRKKLHSHVTNSPPSPPAQPRILNRRTTEPEVRALASSSTFHDVRDPSPFEMSPPAPVLERRAPQLPRLSRLPVLTNAYVRRQTIASIRSSHAAEQQKHNDSYEDISHDVEKSGHRPMLPLGKSPKKALPGNHAKQSRTQPAKRELGRKTVNGKTMNSVKGETKAQAKKGQRLAPIAPTNRGQKLTQGNCKTHNKSTVSGDATVHSEATLSNNHDARTEVLSDQESIPDECALSQSSVWLPVLAGDDEDIPDPAIMTDRSTKAKQDVRNVINLPLIALPPDTARDQVYQAPVPQFAAYPLPPIPSTGQPGLQWSLVQTGPAPPTNQPRHGHQPAPTFNVSLKKKKKVKEKKTSV